MIIYDAQYVTMNDVLSARKDMMLGYTGQLFTMLVDARDWVFATHKDELRDTVDGEVQPDLALHVQDINKPGEYGMDFQWIDQYGEPFAWAQIRERDVKKGV